MASIESVPRADSGRVRLPPWTWPAVKALVIVAVVAAVGWQFASALLRPEFRDRPFTVRPVRLVAAGGLYLVGLGFPALYWYGLLRALGQRPAGLSTVRAYYVGQLGRYVPGKVVGLGMRARMLVGPGVDLATAVLTIVYETLTTLASGALLGLVVMAFRTAGHFALSWRTLALLAAVGGLAVPQVFNAVAERASRPFRRADAPPLPRVRGAVPAAGLALGCCGWCVQGGALYLVVTDVAPATWSTPVEGCLLCAAYAALAYAAGFLVLAAPAGLGVRDFLIQQFVAADLGRTMEPERAVATAAAVALLLRVLWTVADVAAAGVSYWLPHATDVKKEQVSHGE